jgi:serine/threonine transporter
VSLPYNVTYQRFNKVKGKRSKEMKKFWDKWTEIALVKRILVGLILGAILGIAVPQATGIAILGDVFVSALKAIAPLLVFFLVISSLCNAGKSHGGVIKTVIILYMFSTVLAAVIAVFASMAFPVKLTLANAATDTSAPQGIAEVLNNLLLNVVANPVSSLVNANYVGILMWAVLLGLAFRAADKMTKKVLADVADGISMVVTWIINLAPVGIFGLVFNTVSTNGLDIFTTYGKLLVLLVGCMLFIYFVTNPILVYWCIRQNPYPLIFHCLKRSALTAFFTRSSAANIPVNMKVCEEMGLDRDTYSVTIPLGATINMDGTAIMQGVAVVFVSQAFGIPLTLTDYLTVIATATIASIGTAGVPSVGLITLSMVFTSVGLPVEGIALIMGIDRILDMTRTAVNITGDAVCTTIIAHQNKELRREVYERMEQKGE